MKERKTFKIFLLAFIGALIAIPMSCSLSPRLTNLPNITSDSTTDSSSYTMPLVYIDSPTNGQVIFSGFVEFRGRASIGFKEIWVIIEGVDTLVLHGTTNWVTNTALAMGSYIVKVFALDNFGNYSSTNSVNFIVGGKYVFVSTNGNDSNNGVLPSSPVRSLPKALEIANNMSQLTNVEIRLGVGLYSNGDGLNDTIGAVISRPNLLISGGWDENFSNVISKSELYGSSENIQTVLLIQNTTNVTLRNIVVSYWNLHYPGIGIFISNASYITIESNNSFTNNSETVVAEYLSHGKILSKIQHNRESIKLKYSSSTKVIGEISSNWAGITLEYSTNITVTSRIFDNYSGVFLKDSISNTINGEVFKCGSRGISLENSPYNVINSHVYSNSSGGIKLIDSPSNIINGNVYGNYIPSLPDSPLDTGGGIHLYNSPYTLLRGNVYNNSAPWAGGVYLENSDYFTNLGWITNNESYLSPSGGGVFTNSLHENSYFGNVTNNYPTDFN